MKSNCQKLPGVISVNTVVMFLLTYALIDSWNHFYPNITRVYMAPMMVAPMLILMLWVMLSMYENRRLNTILYLGFFAAVRRELPPGAYSDPGRRRSSRRKCGIDEIKEILAGS